jgi:putative aldouronate transport system substrate-binding protein
MIDGLRSRKTVGLCLAALIAVLATACTAAKEQSAPAVPSPTPAAKSEEKVDPLGKYATPINITVGMPVDSTIKFISGESMENNIWTKTLAEKLGINVKVALSAMGEQYTQKVNVSIASNELPDLINVSDTQLKQLVEVGAVEDLTAVFDKYATPWLKSFYEIDQGRAMAGAKFDGKLMAMPGPGSHLNNLNLLWIRKDWLDKLSLPEPKTMQDLYKISEAFAKQDPDGNGKADTFGLGTDKDLKSLLAFMNGFHAYPQTWLKDSAGKLVYGSIQPEVKQALAKLQEMYKNGLLDKEFGVKDAGKLNQDIAGGKVGVLFGSQGTPLTLRNSVVNDPKADWLAYAIPSIDDKPARPVTISKPSSLVAVKKGMKNPEVVVKLASFYAELVGPRATKEDYDKLVVRNLDDGKGGKTSIQIFSYAPVRGSAPDKNLNAQKHITEAMKSGDTSKLTAEEDGYLTIIKEFTEKKDPNGWGYFRIFGPVSSWSVIESQYLQKNLPIYNEFTGTATETMAQKQATLTKMEMETFTKVIMGAISIDEFDTFATDWKKLGGDQITKEVNDWKSSQK